MKTFNQFVNEKLGIEILNIYNNSYILSEKINQKYVNKNNIDDLIIFHKPLKGKAYPILTSRFRKIIIELKLEYDKHVLN